MKDIKDMKHYEPGEKLVNVLMRKTQNNTPLFFRVLVAYYFCKVTSMMRIGIDTPDRGVIPVSMYAMNLAVSGTGKGHSTNIIEDNVINQFKKRYLHETFPVISEKNLAQLAVKRASRDGEDPDDVLTRVKKEFEDLGALVFSFDSGTTPAVKQMRHKLLMANAGSVNLEIDEIGSNLVGNIEVLNTFLELFDVGKVKQKLVKNTSDNKRGEEIEGRTPTNMLLFGTPKKLLDGGRVEVEFDSMLETGYARRCFFGYQGSANTHNKNRTAQQLYDEMTNSTSADYLKEISNKLGKLADPVNFNQNLIISKAVTLELLEYKIMCEDASMDMPDYNDIPKAEISHRYYKTLKLAGAYAFTDGSPEITMDHLHSAIKLSEESGVAFTEIIKRERDYVRLAKYIATIGREVTQVDLMEDLPFYSGSDARRKELLMHAMAYGVKNNIVIKRSYSDGIEFLEGESMEVTDLSKVKVSYSTDITTGFLGEEVPFDKLHTLVKAPGYHYTAHHFVDGYRHSANLIKGVNLLVLDVDEKTNMIMAKELLKEYTYLIATTKRHTPELNRFRIILPMSHIVKLDVEAHSKFMENVFNWLPFDVDTSTKDCARKWESNNGDHYYNAGQLIDATLFIPQTRKEEEQNKRVIDMGSLTNLERWFALNTGTGNRSNQLIRFAYVLIDAGMQVEGVRNAVKDFNKKMKNPLKEAEIDNTIMVTVVKKIHQRDTQ